MTLMVILEELEAMMEFGGVASSISANSSRDCLSIDTYRMCDVVQPLTTCQETIASFTLLGFASAPRGVRQKLPHEVRNVCLRQRDEERPRKAALFGAQLTARSR